MKQDINRGNRGAPPPAYRLRAEEVAQTLRNEIFTGELRPGAPLRQESIADQLGVSRIPVRQALHLLETEGLVVIRPHSGARVAVHDFAEFVGIYMIRERLEPLAFSESIERLTDEQLETVVEHAAQLEAFVGDQNLWIEGDRQFHLACYAGVPSGVLLKTIVGFWNTTQQYRRILLSTFTAEEYELVQSEHRLIVDAAVNRDLRGGEDLIRLHLERSRRRLSRNRRLFDQ